MIIIVDKFIKKYCNNINNVVILIVNFHCSDVNIVPVLFGDRSPRFLFDIVILLSQAHICGVLLLVAVNVIVFLLLVFVVSGVLVSLILVDGVSVLVGHFVQPVDGVVLVVVPITFSEPPVLKSLRHLLRKSSVPTLRTRYVPVYR
jgi:hypothetical protein